MNTDRADLSPPRSWVLTFVRMTWTAAIDPLAMTRFHKMHGLGNDFVILDPREQALAMGLGRARAIADRRHWTRACALRRKGG